MIGVHFEPIDTWFFRDGTPFNSDDGSQFGVASIFPPNPGTLVGALRAALAAGQNWSGKGRWDPSLDKVIGNGQDLGSLSFDAPFLLHQGAPLFAAPRHLLGRTDRDGWTPEALLRPGDEAACDLGAKVKLPTLPDSIENPAELKTGDNRWLTRAGLNAVLAGELPQRSEVITSSDLWTPEPRIGLELDPNTRTAKKGMLYSTQHIRPASGVSLGTRIHGLPEHWSPPCGDLVPLGGESRLAECQAWDGNLGLVLPLDRIGADGKIALISLTPLDIGEKIYTGLQPLDALGGARVVSACLDRPQRIGGWDSLNRRPLPLRSVLPAGSTLFCETDDPAATAMAIKSGDGVMRLGQHQEWGFGLVAPAVWPK